MSSMVVVCKSKINEKHFLLKHIGNITVQLPFTPIQNNVFLEKVLLYGIPSFQISSVGILSISQGQDEILISP